MKMPFFLYHKSDNNIIIEDHDEFGYGKMNSYVLKDVRIEDGDGIDAGIAPFKWVVLVNYKKLST